MMAIPDVRYVRGFYGSPAIAKTDCRGEIQKTWYQTTCALWRPQFPGTEISSYDPPALFSPELNHRRREIEIRKSHRCFSSTFVCICAPPREHL
jgi:hypothetical protein